MERSSSQSQAFEITLLTERAKGDLSGRRRERPGFAPNALLRYGLDRSAPRRAALRYLEEVIAPRAIGFCHRLARRLARYR